MMKQLNRYLLLMLGMLTSVGAWAQQVGDIFGVDGIKYEVTGSDEQESVDTKTIIDDDVITPLSRRDSYLWED